MSTIATATEHLPLQVDDEEMLHNGDRLDQPTFHRLYERARPGFRAELIRGVVFVASPVSIKHGAYHTDGSYWVRTYALRTPGLLTADNTTVVLGNDDSELQPDVFLSIIPPGGTREDCRAKAPELVVEIAYSSHAYDLYEKKDEYERLGVNEYVVVALKQQRVLWFKRNAHGHYEAHLPDAAGVFRSEVFPGLWLDSAAYLRLDLHAVLATLDAGLATPEHAAFVASRSS